MPTKKGQFLTFTLILLLIGFICGGAVSIFLHTLNFVTTLRQQNSQWIYGLPIVGLLIPLLYKFDFKSIRGFKLILEELRQPQQTIPWKMAPLVYITTLLSHLVGASAGRESTALQMSTSLADKVGQWFSLAQPQRTLVLRAGLSSGFAAALGAPWAGMFFGLELLQTTQWRKWNFKLIFSCCITSWIAWITTLLLKSPHFTLLNIDPPEFSSLLLFHLLLLALFVGFVSRLYSEAIKQTEFIFKWIPENYRTAVGGLLLLMLYLLFPLTLYQGLGLESIASAFTQDSPYEMPLIKLLLTVLTLSVGFKGGDFIPLVFIGTTLSSALAHHWHEPLSFFSALGFVSLFGAASKTPLTCAILAGELFGWRISTYAFLITFGSYATAGPHGIYSNKSSSSTI